MLKVMTVLLISLMFLAGSVFSSEKGSGSGSSAAIDKNTSSSVQAAIIDLIDKKLGGSKTCKIDGAEATFDYLHSGVSQEDGLYVSCADFKSGEDVLDLDFYVKEDKGKYKVVKKVLHKKNGQEVYKILWEEGQVKCPGKDKKGSGTEKKGHEHKGSGH